jgi:hypothetical protein
MAGFLFRLETVDGAPAEPPTLSTAVPNWKPGDTIPLGRRTLRVVGKRDEDADQPPVLVVKDVGWGVWPERIESALACLGKPRPTASVLSG